MQEKMALRWKIFQQGLTRSASQLGGNFADCYAHLLRRMERSVELKDFAGIHDAGWIKRRFDSAHQLKLDG